MTLFELLKLVQQNSPHWVKFLYLYLLLKVCPMSVPQEIVDALNNVDSLSGTLTADYAADAQAQAAIGTAQSALTAAVQAQAQTAATVVSGQQALTAAIAQVDALIAKDYPTQPSAPVPTPAPTPSPDPAPITPPTGS